MKKLILLAFTTLMMAGCRYTSGIKPNTLSASNPVIIVDENTQDSCEYYPHYGHKGDCRFCKERRQKELEELIIKLKDK